MSQLPLLFPQTVKGQGTAAPLVYTMYVLPISESETMTEMVNHQELKDQQKLEQVTNELLGRVIFLSHQWLGAAHPDPNTEQFKVLKRVLERLQGGAIPSVESFYLHQLVGGNTVVTAEQWKASLPEMFLWLDYASVPGTIASVGFRLRFGSDERLVVPCYSLPGQQTK